MIASTAYLDLFLRSITETALLKTFLRFLLIHRHDSSTILDTLVGRIASNSRVRGRACAGRGLAGRKRAGTGLPCGHARPPVQSE